MHVREPTCSATYTRTTLGTDARRVRGECRYAAFPTDKDGLRVQDEYGQNGWEDRPLPHTYPADVEYVEKYHCRSPEEAQIEKRPPHAIDMRLPSTNPAESKG